MIVDELILKLQADLGDIKKSLKQVESDAAKSGKEAGAKMGKEAGTSFGDVFNAIAGAAVLNTVKGFFSKAAQEFNKMEAAMMRVDSIAKGFGRSVEVAKKQVNELADKGFLNLNQAASSYADAIALGFDEKQARKFIDSLSDIAAFQNTIGNGAEAVQSGLAGLLSNSAEKVENIGVPVKVLNQEYQKNIATMGKAAALQKFYNGILKESDKFQGDAARSVDTLAGAQNKYNAAVDKAMVTVGKGLEPTLKILYQTGQRIFLAFAEWFGRLNEGTQTILLLGGALIATIPAIGAIGKAMALLSLNPVMLTIMAVAAAFLALSAAASSFEKSGADILKNYREQKTALNELGEKARDLAAINKRTKEQEEELLKTKEALRKKAKDLGLDYDELVKKLGGYMQAMKAVETAEKMRSSKEIIKKIEETKKFVEEVAANPEAAAGVGYDPARVRTEGKAKLEELKKQHDEIWQDASGNMPAPSATAGAGTEQRFLDAQNKLKEIEKNLLFTISQAKGVKDKEERERRINAAIEDAKIQADAEFTSRRQAYAEFIENKYMADTEALKKSTDDAIRASNELLEAELKKAKDDEWEIASLKEDNEERIQKIKESNIKKQAQLTAQSFADTAKAANDIITAGKGIGQGGLGGAASAFGGVAGGAGGLGKGLEGLGLIDAGGGLSKGLGALGVAAPVLGAVGTVVSTISGLFGKSEEDKQREQAELERRHQEQLKILQLQEDHQKNMLALQEAAAKTPFENLQRNLRLIDIQAQQQKLSGVPQGTIDAQRLSARQSAFQSILSEQGGKIAEGALFGDVQATPESLIAFMNKRAEEALAISQFNALIQSTQDPNMSLGRMREIYNIAQSYSGKIPGTLYTTGIEGVKSVTDYLSDIRNYDDTSSLFETDAQREERQGIVGLAVKNALDRSRNLSQNLLSEISTDTGRAESLVSVLEQSLANQQDIKENTRKTAENTSKALELRPDRERSFIDVGLGFMQSLGQRITSPSGRSIAASLSQQNFSIPAEIGSASVTSSRARTLQERMADALEMQLMQGATANDILRDIRALTYDLLAVMDGDTSTGASFSQQDFINFSSDVKRRRI